MAKKKTRQPKPKQLRLVNRSPIGLTELQAKEFSETYRPLGRLSDGASITDIEALRRISLDRYLCIYVEALCHDARLENSNTKKGRTTALRKKILSELSKLCGREFTPKDFIKQLSKFSPLPEFAASAIRRDYLTISIT